MNTLWQFLKQAPLGLVYVALVVLQRHRTARIGAMLGVLGTVAAAFVRFAV